MRDLHRMERDMGARLDSKLAAVRASRREGAHWQPEHVAEHHAAWDEWRADRLRLLSMRHALRKPFPRDLGVHPHQLLANVIAARQLYLGLCRGVFEGKPWDRRKGFVFDRLHRKLFGESVHAWARRLTRGTRQ